VVGFMKPRRFTSGTTIIRQGEATDTGFMVLVLDGEITVENLVARRGHPVTVNVLGPGSLIGEMALVDGAARSARRWATAVMSLAAVAGCSVMRVSSAWPSGCARASTSSRFTASWCNPCRKSWTR
jgi:hypothetical protein